ncbi:MAG: hypothetical protein ACRC6M_08800 [Microcystaceae cyanobacterium]
MAIAFLMDNGQLSNIHYQPLINWRSLISKVTILKYFEIDQFRII